MMMWLVWLMIIAGAVIIDRITKYLTVAYLAPIGDYPLIEGWLHLSYVENTGAAFGMLKDHRMLFLIGSAIGILALLAFLIWKEKQISVLGKVALCLVIGGGIGNQIDRLIQGYVVDMIYVKIIDFAVFNAADTFVCVGAGLMVICCLTLDRWLLEDEPKKPRRKDAAKASDLSCEEDQTGVAPMDASEPERESTATVAEETTAAEEDTTDDSSDRSE